MKQACSLLVAVLLIVPARAQLDGSHGELRRAMGWLDAPRDLARELALGYYLFGTFGDIDGDGLTDLLAFRAGENAILPVWNLGHDEYGVGLPFGTSSTAYVRILADVTGDGLADLVTDHNGSPLGLLVHVNLGGAFAPLVQVESGDRRVRFGTSGEVDGDIALELAMVDEDLAQQNHQVRWLDWNGSTFVAAPGASIGTGVSSLAADDLDGDGRDDVVVGTSDTGEVLAFTTASDGSLSLAQTLPGISAGLPIVLTTGDLGQDGDVDVLALSRAGIDLIVTVLRNDGKLPLVPEAPQVFSQIGSGGAVYLADWDADGDLDAVVSGSTVLFLENRGDATFEASGAIPFRSAISPALGVTDLNGDGYLDFVGRCCVKSGNGHFEDPAAELPGSPDFARAIDLDGDGDLDVVSRNADVLENDGAARFTSSRLADWFAPPPPTQNFGPVSLGDFTGDGLLDVLVRAGGGLNTTMALGRGTGPGSFEYGGPAAAVNVLVGSDLLIELPPVDLDGDDDLDVIGQEGWGENDGTGTFTVNASWDVYRLTAGDVDRDGDVDVAGATSGMATLFRNQGAGTFEESLLSDASSGESHFVDLDADGYCEFVIGAYPPVIRVYANVGGDFPYPPLELATPSFTQDFQAFDDFDGDGRLDILGTRPRFESLGGEETLIWRQLPGPGLAFAPPRHHYTEVRPVVRGDFDGDGDLDLLRERLIRGWRFNAGRDGKIRRVTEPPLPGGSVQPQLNARGSLVAGSRLTLSFTNAPGPGWIVITSGAGTPEVTLPVGDGQSSLTVPVTSGLAGVELSVQAFFLEPTSKRLLRSNVLDLGLARPGG